MTSNSVEGTRVALLGFGTVGQSVARILCSGEVPGVQLTHICNRNVARKRVDWVPASVCWTESAEEILKADVDIIIESLRAGLPMNGSRRPARRQIGGDRKQHSWRITGRNRSV